ncbi:alpha/beta fold hydrolase [Aquipuribacter hungaricus]|uniref:Alpha/beta fold hydrolase n=1 Tax=Aquipuribacter hungaricus TaxID=545624 RepID=A0ABV7WIM6_9MICO
MPLHDTHRVRRSGAGRPMVLVHGLGASFDCWREVEPLLRRHREVVVMDLPGFGAAEPLGGDVSIDAFADHLADLLEDEDLLDADLVGSSMGGEVVLELLRRGVGTGDVVAIAPSGYWGPWGLAWFRVVAWSATGLVTALRPVAHHVIGNPWGRRVLLRPLSPVPALLPEITADATHTFGNTHGFLPALRHLGGRRDPVRVPAGTAGPRRVSIVWGRRDGLCLPGQASAALEAVPDATLHWLDGSGHLPPWDEPQATAELLLRVTGAVSAPDDSLA